MAWCTARISGQQQVVLSTVLLCVVMLCCVEGMLINFVCALQPDAHVQPVLPAFVLQALYF